jgi:hypothetical protein
MEKITENDFGWTKSYQKSLSRIVCLYAPSLVSLPRPNCRTIVPYSEMINTESESLADDLLVFCKLLIGSTEKNYQKKI